MGDVPNLVAQAPLVVFPHVHPVHQDLPFGGVVEPGDQVDHGALAAAGGADDGHRLPPLGGEGDVFEDVLLRVRIAEGDVAELHLAGAGGVAAGLGAVQNGGVGVEDLPDAVGGHRGPGEDHKDHHQHHEGHDHLDGVLGKDHHVGEQGELGLHPRLVDEHAADPVDGQGQAAHHQLDAGQQEGQGALGEELVAGEGGVGLGELGLLVVLGVVGPHHPQAGEVLPGDPVEVVGEFLHPAELGGGQQQADPHHHQQNHHRHGGGQGPLPLLAGDLIDGEHRHDGGPQQHLQAQDDEHLDLGHVVSGAGDEAGGGEAADLLHGEGLHFGKQPAPEGGPQGGGDAGRADGGDHRGSQAAQGTHQHHPPGGEDLPHGAAGGLDQGGDLGHIVRGFQIQPHLNDDEGQTDGSQEPVGLFQVLEYGFHGIAPLRWDGRNR